MKALSYSLILLMIYLSDIDKVLTLIKLLLADIFVFLKIIYKLLI